MKEHVFRYRSEIDGLRGIAILGVLANHVDSNLLSGGFVGVDVFFVISGYLITSILLRDAGKGSISFTRFFARRVRRLLPAGAVMCAVVVLISSFVLLPREFKDLGASLVAFAAFTSNVLFWRWDDYFAGQTRTWPLLHTWSLAIEEQFYLIFPWIVPVIARQSRRLQASALGCLFLVSFGISVWQSHHDHRSAYYLLPSRAWELVAGALCAVAPTTIVLPRVVGNALECAFAAAVVLPMAAYSEQTVFPGWAAFVPVVGTCGLILMTNGSGGPLQGALSRPWLVWVGKVSYSLYLWHWPLLTLIRYPWSGMAGSCPWAVPYVAGAVSFPVAWFSYRYIETPGRSAGLSDRRALIGWAASAGVMIGCGLLIHQSGGLPQRLSAAAVQMGAGTADFQDRRRETIDLPIAVVNDGVMPRLGVRSNAAPPAFVLWGDSHADALVPAFDVAAKEWGLSGIALTRGATPPLVGITSSNPGRHPPQWDFRDAAIKRIERERPSCVVLAARWSSLLKCDLSRDGQVACTPEERCAFVAQSFKETIDKLSGAGASHIWILGEVPTQRFNVPKQLGLRELFGWQDVTPRSFADHQAALAPMAKAFESMVNDNVSYLDLGQVVTQACHKGLLINGSPAYCDDTHLSATAARNIRSQLSPIFESMGAPAKVSPR